MDYNILLQNNSKSYRAKQKIVPSGIILDVLEVTKPYLNQYLGPNDGRLGNSESYRKYIASEKVIDAHAFIGADKHGVICTYQTLPLGFKCLDLQDPYSDYLKIEVLKKVSEKDIAKLANEISAVCLKWCKTYNIQFKNIISNNESNSVFCTVRDIILSKKDVIEIGDKVKIKEGIDRFYDGNKIPSIIQKSELRVREKKVINGEEILTLSLYSLANVCAGALQKNNVTKQWQ